MTPDKIYCWSGVMGSIYASSQKPSVKTEEYIRKDALLEWANIMKRICKGAEPIEKAFQTMIDKIESL